MYARRNPEKADAESDRKKTVLVVDDEAGVREFVDRALRHAGYQTAVASDGPEALDVAERLGSFDLLVTDLRMPQMMGDELARRMRLRDPAIKVLYLTGFSDQLFKDRTSLWQDEAFLDKPQGVDALLEAVSLLLFGTIGAKRA